MVGWKVKEGVAGFSGEGPRTLSITFFCVGLSKAYSPDLMGLVQGVHNHSDEVLF